MLTTGELIDWLKQFPNNTLVIGEYFEKSNIIDLKVILHTSGGEADVISTIEIE